MEISDLKDKLKEEISVISGIFYGSLGVISRGFFAFIVNLILARQLLAENYGIWSLICIIISIIATASLMGLERGLSSFIGRYRGNQNKEKLFSSIRDSFIIGIFSSLFFSILLFLLSDQIAIFFKIGQLSLLLKIIALTFIPAVFTEITASVFQGYENTKIARLINSFTPSFIFLLFVFTLSTLKELTLLKIIISYVAANWAGAIIALIFLVKLLLNRELNLSTKELIQKQTNTKIALICFSFPLMLFGLISNLGIYIDGLIVGYFLGAQSLGIYNIAAKIAKLSPLLLMVSTDIFTPILSKNISLGSKLSISEIYFRTTKWLFIPTFAIIISVIIFPSFFMGWFGGDFKTGSTALQLLMISSLIYVFCGPTESINIALGDTKFVAWYTLIGASVTAALCFILVPKFGINAAATVSIISMLIVKAIAISKLKIKDGIKIFDKKYFTFTTLGILLGICGAFLIKKMLLPNLIGVIVFSLYFITVEFLILWKTGLIDEKDILIKDLFLHRISNLAKIKK